MADESTERSNDNNEAETKEDEIGSTATESTKREVVFSLDAVNKEDAELIENPLKELTDEELVQKVEELRLEVNHLRTENEVFEKFLRTYDPAVLEGMDKIVNNAMRLLLQAENGTSHSLTPTAPQVMDSVSSTTLLKLHKLESVSFLSLEKGMKINLTQKNELISKDMEDVERALLKLFKKSHRKKCNLKAELEELSDRINETNDAYRHFEQSVLIDGVDPLTQRIPAEKFIRYMQEWLKTSAITLQKLRLRVSTFTVHIKKLQHMLNQKKELGESLHAVDFEKLQIENSHFVTQIDQKTLQLIDLKKMNGRANLILTNQKKCLQKQLLDMKKLQHDIDSTKLKIEDIEKETEKAEDQLEKEKSRYESIKTMIEEYSVPDVMDYVKNRAKLNEIRKNINIWSRRNHLQSVALKSTIREMKNITGSKKVLDSWFIPYKENESEDETGEEDDSMIRFSFSNFKDPK